MNNALRTKSDYYRTSRVGLYVIRYKLDGQNHADKWDNNVRPGYVIESLKRRGATGITITKH